MIVEYQQVTLTSSQELQLQYGTINLNNQLKTSL